MTSHVAVLSMLSCMCIATAGCGADPKDASPDSFAWTDTADTLSDITDSGGVDDGAGGIDAAILPAGARCGVNVLTRRVAPWPGGGIQLLVSVEADGSPAELSASPAPFLRAGDGTRIELARQPAEVRTRIGVVLARSTDATGDQRTVQLAHAFLDGLVFASDGVKDVILWGVDGATPTLLSEATGDRARLKALADAWLSARPAVAVTADGAVTSALIVARDQLARVGGPDGPANRSLVAFHPAGAVIGDGQAGVGVDAVRVHHVFVHEAIADARVTTLASQIPNLRKGFARLGACAAPLSEASVTLVWGDAECPIAWPPGEPRLSGQGCDAAGAANDDYPWGDTVRFVFTPDEAAVWEDRRATKSRDDFAVGVQVDRGDALRATARLRGHSSLGCERKSYTVNIQGSNPYRLMPGGASDKFYLIAMCLDEGYFNQLFADHLGQVLGFFPLEFRVVRLVAGGVDQGAYLMLEKADAAVVQDMVSPWAVIRRRFDPEDEPPDIDWTADGVGDADALAFWRDLNAIATTAPEAELEASLGARMDLDGYLQWLAFNTFMRNGDYIDEVVFFGAHEGSEPNRLPFMHIIGWDPDDLFSDCHHSSIFAIEDPHNLLFCAEGDLDQALMRSPAIYARFVQHLELVMDTLPAAALADAMAMTRNSLLAIVNNDTTAAAMVEIQGAFPDAKSAAGFDAAVTGLMDALLQKAETSRSELRTRIATWRAGVSQ